MAKRQINVYLFIGLIGVVTSGSMLFTHMYQAFWGDENIWWTHSRMNLTVEETGDRFRMTIGGKALRKHLSDGTLFAVDPNGDQYRVVSRDVGVRVNNWDRVKGTLLTGALPSSFGFGVSLALLIVGLVDWVKKKKG
jgi:hypothetical protein